MSELWLGTWWEAFGAGRELRILAADEQSRACWPMFGERRRGLRRLNLIGNSHCRHELERPEEIPRLATRLALQRDWDELVFTSLPLEQARAWSDALAAAGLPVTIFPPWKQRYIPLGRPWPAVEGELRPGLVSSVRRRERALEKLAPLSLRIHTEADGLDTLLSECMRVEASGWKGAAKTAMACQPEHAAFYRKLANRAAAEGALYLALLYSGDHLIAFALRLRYGQNVVALKIGYLDSWRKYAPGTVLGYRLLRHLHDAGIVEYDLGGGSDAYKADWTPHARLLADVHAFHQTARGRVAAWGSRSRRVLREARRRWAKWETQPPAAISRPV